MHQIYMNFDFFLFRYCRFSTSYDKYSHHHMTREIWDNVDTND
ncbi:hypothetical protein HanPI659440_Chr10g0369611 [Helianthus annuus]|nr:hypothetical protein HanPI659440_Chr10g0369611 [Helianthus annuus]